MKKITILLTGILIITTLLLPMTAFAATDSSNISIAFTNDIHSHLDSSNDEGGLAKIKTQLDDIEKDNEGTFILDAGNFSMGTPFQTIFPTSAAELRMLGNLNYDVVALGNSEFNYGAKNLAKMLNRAKEEKTTTKETKTEYNTQTYTTEKTTTFSKSMPEVVCGNINWQSTLKKKNNEKDAKRLQSAWKNYDVQDYTIVEKNNVKMAVIGLVGNEAVDGTTNSQVIWQDSVTRAKEIVEEITKNKEADMIVCLSSENPTELAKQVPDIDLIINSDRDENIKEPLVEGDTTIVGTEGKTNKLGHLTLKKTKGKYKVEEYNLISIDKTVEKDSTASSQVSEFKSTVNADYMGKYGYTYDEELAKNKNEITDTGDLISDSFIGAVKKAEKSKYETVDVSIVSKYSIGAGLEKGTVTAGEAYDLCGLGVGANGTSGYPLVTGYLTGKELKKLVEVNASISSKEPNAKLYISGISYSYNSHRLYLNKAYDIQLIKEDGTSEKINNDNLYRVVTGLAELENLSRLEDVAAGMLKVVPKEKDGKKITDTDSMIVKRGSREVKEWEAAADYIDGFRGNKVPNSYTKASANVTDETGFNPVSLFRSPNNIGLIAIAIVLIIVAIIIGIILFLRQRKFDKRGFGKRVFKQKKRRIGKPTFKQKKMRLGKRRRKF